MRKMIILAMAVMLCMTMVLPVCAQNQEFVPSITYKDGLESVKAEMNGENIDNCVVVTSIKEAREKSTDISQTARDLLLEVYEKLKDGTMKLPLDKAYVIVELVDISFAQTGCVEATEHDHLAWLMQESNVITVDLGHMAKDLDLSVLSYNDGQWNLVEKVTNNGDGTYTCVFEHFCPVAFCAEADTMEEIPTTGDAGNVFLWLAVMLAAAVALAGVLVASRRRAA